MSHKMCFVVSVLICVIGFTGSLFAGIDRESQDLQSAQISTGDELSFEAGMTVDVPIVLSTTKPLAGIQISLEYDDDVMTPGEPVTTERTAGMSVAHNVTDNKILILMYDVSGKTIPSGDGSVLTLPFTVSPNAVGQYEIVFQEVILADERANAVPAEVKSTPVTIEKALPTEYDLIQNYPNPFNPETVIEFQLPEESYVHLTIFNVLGQEIHRLVDERKSGGFYKVIWDGRNEVGEDVSSGVYFFRLQAGDFVSVKKMMLLK
jgi:hypothetical protein